ncbi:hypothetical protein ACM26X_10755 [Kluyvera cryocrescens]|uniref:hypothetical protein n=1 Tax=Enterobacteriaceae TaxID=543 RepID=UPI00295C6666|nr:hypothetical protein [Citrobacter freundii]
MPLASYPHEYLPLPQQDGYGLTPVSPTLRTKLTSGRSRQRRKYTSVPTEASVSWFMESDSQAQLFEAWHRDVIHDGVDWFLMRLQTPLGVEDYKCRFTDIYVGPTLVAPIYWKFTATLELWERPILPPGWGNFPEFIVGQSIIDYALNKEWPEA